MSVEAVPLKYYPVNVTCPKCKQDIKTKTDGKVSKSGWIMGLALCFCGWVTTRNKINHRK